MILSGLVKFFVSLINNNNMQKGICLCAHRCVVCTTESIEIGLNHLQDTTIHKTHTYTSTHSHTYCTVKPFLQSSSHTLNLPFATFSSCPPLNKHRPALCVSHLCPHSILLPSLLAFCLSCSTSCTWPMEEMAEHLTSDKSYNYKQQSQMSWCVCI